MVNFVVILRLFIIGFAAFCISSTSFSKTLLLVPGFFNSAIPGDLNKIGTRIYWSEDIRSVFRDAGYKVFVVDNLSPVGSIEANGSRLLEYIKNYQGQFDGDGSFDIVAHSAGGLYTLYANNKEPLPINRLVTINTPFDGVEFIETISDYFPQIVTIEKRLNLMSINQLRPANVRRLLSKLKAVPHFPIRAYTGFQPRGRNYYNAAFLSPVFYVTQSFMNQGSDGIVTYNSALGRSKSLDIEVDGTTEDYIHLDHWKQTAGSDLFKLLGMTNTDYIRKEQKRFYHKVLKYLEN